MRKTTVMMAVAAVAMLTLSGCGSKEQVPAVVLTPAEENLEGAEPEVIIENAFEKLETADDEAVEKNLETINEEIETLAENGYQEKALMYWEKLKAWYSANKEKVKNSEAVQRLSEKTEELAKEYKLDELKQKAVEKVDELKDEYGDDVKDKIDEAKGKIEDFKAEHGDEAKEALNEIKERAKDLKSEVEERARQEFSNMHE